MSDPHAELHESNRTFYDRIAKSYDLISDASERQARLAGVEALKLRPGERVLEIGFGTGNELAEMAIRVAPGGKVCGIDISEGMLEVARGKLAKASQPISMELKLGDARNLPYPDGSFDGVYCSFTLELFPEDEMPVVLAQVRRVLRPGGRLAVVAMATVKPGENPSLLEKTYVWFHRHFPHIVDCRPIDLETVLKSAGFAVADRIDLEIWTLPVAAVVAS